VLQDPDLLYWVVGRVSGLSCYAALSISVLSGLTIRSRSGAAWTGRKPLVALHEYTTVLWMPLGLIHVQALLLDHISALSVWDAVIPFRAGYGTVGIGLGSIAFDLIVLLAITTWARRFLSPAAWLFIHRLAYPAFVFQFLHSVLSGTDFSQPPIAIFTWGCAAALAVAGAARVSTLLKPA
jgi:sulfoxide reductase heme-binding subunit YedZ